MAKTCEGVWNLLKGLAKAFEVGRARKKKPSHAGAIWTYIPEAILKELRATAERDRWRGVVL